jgi:ABC-2 type transport system ATP-binding protein
VSAPGRPDGEDRSAQPEGPAVDKAAEADLAIDVRGLGRAFGSLWAVRGMELAVRRGEIFGLVGPDGAGKTTTLRMLAGVLAPSEGQAQVAGHSVTRDPEAVKARIGYMSQRFGLYGDLTVLENLRFYAELYEVPRAGRAALEQRLLGFSNLEPFRDRLARDLSGGMKQKLGLACALVHRPELLLLDEPTNGVDPVSRRDFWRILYAMRQEGVTMLVSTAYLDEAERCTRVGLVDGGRLVEVDTPQRLRASLPGALHEFEVDQPRAAQQALARVLGAARVSLFGGKLHLLADDAAQLAAAERALAEAGHPPRARRAIAPSLEDVFIARLGAQEPA